jgi:hypothetical protein
MPGHLLKHTTKMIFADVGMVAKTINGQIIVEMRFNIAGNLIKPFDIFHTIFYLGIGEYFDDVMAH